MGWGAGNPPGGPIAVPGPVAPPFSEPIRISHVELDGTKFTPDTDSKALARNIAHLVDRYFQNANESDRAAITNLAGLLRHATAYTAALTRELEEWAQAEAIALAERDEALRRADELAEELEQLRAQQPDDDALVRGLQ